MKFRNLGFKNNDQGKFLKIEPDSEKIMVLRGEIAEFGTIGEGKDFKKVAANYPGSKLKFKVNAIVHENGEFVAKIFEFGITIYRQLAELSKQMDLETMKIKIMRKGSKMATDYTVIPVLKEPLSAKQLEEISKVELHFLDVPVTNPKVKKILNFAENVSVPEWNVPMPEPEDEVPF